MFRKFLKLLEFQDTNLVMRRGNLKRKMAQMEGVDGPLSKSLNRLEISNISGSYALDK